MMNPTLPPRFFRPNTTTAPKPVNFILARGGFGDYTAFLSSLLWAAKTFKHLNATLWSPPEFMSIPSALFSGFSNWKIRNRDEITETDLKNVPTFEPTPVPNVLGMHPVDCGFIYYCNLNPPPSDGNFYPEFDFTEFTPSNPVFKNQLRTLGNTMPYVVITAGASYANRLLPPKAFNGIKQYVRDNGFLPVVLGKSQINPSRNILFSPEYDFSDCLSLVDQTDILTAVLVMAQAECVIGLDNGLLHLAATTKVPIVFGFNIASPLHRTPRRRSGKIYEIYPDPEKLSCTFCQSQMRFMFSHDFNACVYKDNFCLGELADPNPWCELFDRALEEREDAD